MGVYYPGQRGITATMKRRKPGPKPVSIMLSVRTAKFFGMLVPHQHAQLAHHFHGNYRDNRPAAIRNLHLLAPHPDDISRVIQSAVTVRPYQLNKFIDFIVKLEPTDEPRLIYRGSIAKGLVMSRFLEGLALGWYISGNPPPQPKKWKGW